MKIYFYPEYSNFTGQGHLKRLIALNDYIRNKFSTVFIFKTKIPKNFKYEFLLLPKSNNYKKDIDYLKNEMPDNSVIVLDGYNFDTKFQERFKKKILSKIIYVDDFGGKFPFADVVVNHAPGVKHTDYVVTSKTKLLLGLDYLLLRKAFVQKNNNSHTSQLDSVFVCFGACDLENFSKRVTEELINISRVRRINLVIGGDYSFSIKWASNKKVKLLKNLNANKMSLLMKKSSLIIVPSSTLVLEALCIGRPIITIKTSENQNLIFKGLKKYDHIYRFNKYNSRTNKLLPKVVLDMLTFKNFDYGHVMPETKKKYSKVFQSL